MNIDATGPDGNAFAIMGKVKNYLQQMNRSDEWKNIQADMMGGNYTHLCEVAERVSAGLIRVINR